MKIKFTNKFKFLLEDLVRYISSDKPIAAIKFKRDLLANLQKDLKTPFHFKKSNYIKKENSRDYVFKGYVTIYEVDLERQIVTVFGFIKY